jgi:hypothetical protein|tara:strand:+ start:1247 stop:1816 length:570 start_codon:yes stop_codon:yes gene_type:complete
MKKNLIRACVLVLMVFSVSKLVEEPIKAPIQKIIVIELPIIIEHIQEPHVTVIADNQLIVDDIDVFCLAKNIFHEAGIEPDIGKYAVAQVTLNRVDSSKYPNTICKVVLQRYQFSWANRKSLHWTHPKGLNWNRSYEIAQHVIYENHRVNGLENVKYYHADYIKPHWSRNMTQVSIIGRHIFYTNDVIY